MGSQDVFIRGWSNLHIRILKQFYVLHWSVIFMGIRIIYKILDEDPPISGYMSGYKAVTMSWYTVAQNDMQLHWFHKMHSTKLTDHHAIAFSDNTKSCNCISNYATVYPHF